MIEHGTALVVRPSLAPAQEARPRRSSFVFDEWIKSLAEATRKSYLASFRQFWEWSGEEEHYPIQEDLLLEWLRHLWKVQKATYSTIRVRLSALSSLHEAMGLEGLSGLPRVRTLLRTIQREAPKKRKAGALRRETLLEWVRGLDEEDPIAIRDRALVMFGWAAGGRRRSEIAKICMEDLTRACDGWAVSIRNHKTAKDADDVIEVFLKGPAAEALEQWLAFSGITEGPVFRGFYADGKTIRPNPLSGNQVNEIVKKTGADSAHSVRSGFMTTCAEKGIRLEHAMAMSGHSSVSTAMSYFRAGNAKHNPASELL